MKRLDLHTHAKIAKRFPLDEGYLAQQLAWAVRCGLDGIAVTEHFHACEFWKTHDLLAAWFPYRQGVYRSVDGFCILPGAEVTLQEGGHLLLLGDVESLRRLDDAFPLRLSQGYRPSLPQLLDRTDSLDLIRIGAHMFRRRKGLRRLPKSDLMRLHALEINGKDCDTAARVVDAAEELGLAVVGGSDAHHWLQVGVHYSLFPIAETTLLEIRKALAARATWHAAAPSARLRVRLSAVAKRWIKRQWKRKGFLPPPVALPEIAPLQ